MNFIRRPSALINNQGYREVLINEFNAFLYCSNSISRTKYHPLTFLPIFIFEQFRNYTNFFFLLISIVQQFPEASFLGRFTTIVPLGIILLVLAIKEIIEDVGRYRADKRINSMVVEVFHDSKWSKKVWGELLIGDIIKVYENEFFAADVLFIKSSNPEACICYIDTANLDGENNLKIRNCVPRIDPTPLAKFKGLIKCDPPNEFIYEFNGVLMVNNSKIPINANHLLLRGSALRNTKWVLGVVVYTGRETKIMKNASSTRLKRSSVSVLINHQVMVLFGLFFGFTTIHWLLYIHWNNVNYKNYWYLPIYELAITDRLAIISILVYGVIYSIIIPISLPVMQEISRIIQGMLIASDLDLYYEAKDQRTVVKTSALNEDLGLVKYIFADKTGTLTKNVLEFRKCSVNGQVYDVEKLAEFENGAKESSDIMRHFFIAINTGPGVIPMHENGELTYLTSSPDQKALILAAKTYGMTLISRSMTQAVLEVAGRRDVYEVLCEFEFTSERKRSSVVVRTPKNELILYVLGADDVILNMSVNDDYKNKLQEHIEDFSDESLRSICVAMVILDESKFEKWYPVYERAQEALHDKERLVVKAEAEIIQNLTLLGCTAVEDMLQDEVPSTISSLLQAGVNVWMLTGDKKETAVNIGYSCQLLSRQLKVVTISTTDLKKLRATINWFKVDLGNEFGRPGIKYGLVVSGSSLKTLFDSVEDVNDFTLLMLSCKAVICCRTTPRQKAQVVKNVQRLTKYVTLAVGDGANDVAMIQTASIGVGISGMEGLQAANAADYAIGQFKHLKKLLLVHGTWCYNRIARMVFLIYYKNVILAVIQFIYTSQNAWSGHLYFDRWGRMMYNVVLTSTSTLALGVLEQNLPASVLMDKPGVYSYNKWFNFKGFWQCVMNAFVHALVMSVLPIIFFWTNVFWSEGKNDSHLISGNIVYTGLIMVVSLKSLLHSSFWTNLTIAGVIMSMISWLLLLWGLSHSWPTFSLGEEMPRAFEIILTTPMFYLYMIVLVTAVFAFDILVVVYVETFKQPMKSVNKLRIEHFRRSKTVSKMRVN